MKSTLILLLNLICLSVPAQKLEIDTILHFDGIGVHDLYLKSKEWTAHRFNNVSEVISMDIEDNFITGRYTENYKILTGPAIPFYFSFKISVKDGRVRIVIDNINNTYYPVEAYIWNKKGKRRKSYNYMYDGCWASIYDFVSSFDHFVKSVDDW